MKKTNRIFALLMAVAMILVSVPFVPAVSAVSETGKFNTNQGDGITLFKDAVPHLENGVPDGTVDIIIEAMTTGAVHNSEKVIPTDIVLVLDVSGSMEQTDAHTVDIYDPVLGTSFRYFGTTYYGFNSSRSYYILVDGEYISVSRASSDRNGCYYYRYRDDNNAWVYVYPELDPSVTANRAQSYDVVQFYNRTTGYPAGTKSKMGHLQDAVINFIHQTEKSNAGIKNDEDKHRISIVKFATNAYYNGSSSTQDENSTVVGNHFNSSDYNYTQIVKELTTVVESELEGFETAVNGLRPTGATAIDYGLALADHALFDDRTAEDIAGRHEIVVLFTDGSPTHGSGYSSSVAADAVNQAAELKKKGVEIYTISVAANADATQLGSDLTNRFCHYVSSNYPDATASGTTINPGTGNTNAGYYWVPNDVLTLDAIFESVLEAVGTPTIELGESAAVIDSLTPYFTLPDGTNDITLQTVTKNATGWDDPEDDDTLTSSIVGPQIKVSGFDFDANYISETPRDNGFYGKMLRVVINVTPNYSVVDERTETIAAAGGYVETNLGNAAVLDSTQTPVAVVASPGLTMNTVTYLLDGNVYKTFYRFPGSDNAVLPKIADNDVNTYTEWTTTDVTVDNGAFTMPEGNVVFNATSTMVEYAVSYQYRGTVPAGAPAVPGREVYKTGDRVKVADVPEVTGYVFSGWQAVEVAPVGGEFDMPSRNVTFIGSFAPSDTVAYKIEHYLQDTNGEFPEEPSDFHYHHDGTTGESVSAIIMDYPQFEYVASVTTPSGKTYTSNPDGVVLADGSLVLRLYYIRNVHTVTYIYDDDTLPANAPALPAPESHRTGETVTLAPVPTLEGYTFIGWASDGADVIISSNNDFLMPDRDVVLHGFFLENGDTKYKVEHYLETDTDGVYETTPAEVTEHEGKTDAPVVGEPLNFEGYTYNAVVSDPTAKGNILPDGSLVLKLYYDKTPYKVSYMFTGLTPDVGFPTLPAESIQHMGDLVDVEAVPVLAGYTFHGWTAGNVKVTNGQFTMPDEDVVFVGYFARNEAQYTVSHYFQLEDGTWGEPQVSYKLDSFEGETVSANYVTVDGYTTYSDHPDTLTTGVVTADDSLELKLFYKRTAFKVTYVYEGTVPAGASVLPDEKTYLHGASVDVEDDASAPGYTFSGWESDTVDVSGGSFVMPQSDVVIYGHFVARTDTPWRVEHYKENLDGTYNSTPDDVDNYIGTTGYRVSATYRQYVGFTPAENNVLIGVITPEPNTLVIKLYYERNTYDVYYRYIGVQPDGAPDISVYNIADVPYGTIIDIEDKPTLENHQFEGWNSNEISTASGNFSMPDMDVVIYGRFVENAKLTVSYVYEDTVPANAPELPATTYHHPKENITVADVPSVVGYTFDGWTSTQVTPVSGKFDMPDENVVFTGKFVPATGTAYKVEHYQQKLDGTYPTDPFETENLTGETGASVTAIAKSYEGFTEDTSYSGRVPSGTILADGSLVLKLYYSRNSYEVKYTYTGDVPADATPLPQTKIYKYGEEVTVADEATAEYYYFIGWNSLDVVPAGGKFFMPAKSVLFSGRFEMADISGTVVINKTVNAPAGFAITTPFEFRVHRVENNTISDYYDTVYVTPGTPLVLTLNPGIYYFTEVGGDVSGFTHSVYCDVANGIIRVDTGSYQTMNFTNTYVAVQLEKDDHFGYIIGYPDGTVRPENNITRAEVATIFFRMLKEDSRNYFWSTTNTFSDVSSSNWFNTAISTLQNADVLDGYSDGTFRPNAYITRAELVKIAMTFYGTPAGMQTHFSDTSAHWASDFIEAARELGIVDGYTDGTFRPDRYVTRAEAMKIINRTLDRIPHKDHLLPDMIKWVDNSDRNKWYYADVQEATNSHIYIWNTEFERWTRILPVRDWAALELGWSRNH
ncbi:MAG: S-layer homology domain-containing protein [Clostridia bacterium]|nr:S-layer homology domain-containing protein [Clostridia bacterium]